jgi:hypothetical protein
MSFYPKKLKEITHDLNDDLLFYCGQYVAARRQSRCLEYLGCITLYQNRKRDDCDGVQTFIKVELLFQFKEL